MGTHLVTQRILGIRNVCDKVWKVMQRAQKVADQFKVKQNYTDSKNKIKNMVHLYKIKL